MRLPTIQEVEAVRIFLKSNGIDPSEPNILKALLIGEIAEIKHIIRRVAMHDNINL